jgi:hypothetical protein
MDFFLNKIIIHCGMKHVRTPLNLYIDRTIINILQLVIYYTYTYI